MNLRAERLNRGLTVAAAALQIGVSRGTLQKAEAGLMPSAPLAKKIADFYGAKVTEIWPLEEAA